MPLSTDPVKREAQLANLRPGAGAGDGGLQRRRVHGAYAAIAERELEAKVRELYDAIGEDLPVRESDGGVPAADAIPLRLLAEVLIRRERVRETEVRLGVETEKGDLRGVVKFGLALDDKALRLCEQLGLTPTSRARLGLDLARTRRAAEGLDRLADEGREALGARTVDAEVVE